MSFPNVPSWPLVLVIDDAIKAHESTTEACRRLGISDRLYRDWRNRARGWCEFDSADRVLQALGLLWWEVYTEDTVRRHAVEVATYSWKPTGTIKRRRIARLRTRATVAVDIGPDLEALALVRMAFTGEGAEDEQMELAA